MRVAPYILVVLFTTFTTFTIFPAFAQESEYSYAVLSTPFYREMPAPLDWDVKNTPIDHELAYRIIDQLNYAKESRDPLLRMAGNYMVAITGCGDYCQSAVLIDVRTGKPVIRLPNSVTGYQYWTDRRLLVVNPYKSGFPQTEVSSTEFYLLNTKEKKLELLAEEPWPDGMTTGALN